MTLKDETKVETPEPVENPESPPLPSQRRRKGRRATLAGLAVAAALAAVVFHRPLFLGNVGEVDPGRVYRCAQPKGNLEGLIEEYGIATILNLRGGSLADDWYVAELEASRGRGLDFYDFPMSATERPSRRELLTLIDLFGRCRYPLLIHCKSGSDRTGLASGLYLMAERGVGPEGARESFSILHGHFPIGGPEKLHGPFLEYGEWLKETGREHSPALLRRWVEEVYRDEGDPEADAEPFEPLEPGPRYGRAIDEPAPADHPRRPGTP